MIDELDNEEWRPVAGAEGLYSVSSLGRVRSEPLPYRTSGRQRGRVLRPARDTKGYPIVRICALQGRSRTTKVHRLVAEAFIGAPGDRQVNHIDGDKTNNRVANLEYVTCRENIQHCWNTGLHGSEHCQGEANKQAKLTEEDVRTIRKLHRSMPLSRIASQFGVTTTNISYIVRRKTWQHV